MPQPPAIPPQYRASMTVVIWETDLAKAQQAVRQVENVSDPDEFLSTIEYIEEGQPQPEPVPEVTPLPTEPPEPEAQPAEEPT